MNSIIGSITGTRPNNTYETIETPLEGVYIPSTTYTFYEPPKAIGHWRIDKNTVYFTQFPMYTKPTDKQIENTEELLGWKWIEA